MARMADTFYLPEGYASKLSVLETEKAIKDVKDYFERTLSKKLALYRVSAPLFVMQTSGLNDNLNGVERPVSFDVRGVDSKTVEIVHSLAKWKRMALRDYDIELEKGLYTDMNAIRRDEDLDNLHSVYVDQWDWEKHINKEMRTEEYLVNVVKDLYSVLKDTEEYVHKNIMDTKNTLPDEIFFITTSELEQMYPSLTPKEREDKIAREKGAVFIMKIGALLPSGIRHDGRAPDYDDWNLNGDIVLYNKVLDIAFEVSSMGIRVDKDTLLSQLEEAMCLDRKKLPFHKDLIEEKLPQSIGGGIGQSRLCMFFLDKAHIGEVQASVWSEEMIKSCRENNIFLL